MSILIDPNSDRIVLNIKEIDEFAHALKKYVDTYYTNIYIVDKEQIKRLERLDKIADALLQRRFTEIFESNVDIEYDGRLLYEIPF